MILGASENVPKFHLMKRKSSGDRSRSTKEEEEREPTAVYKYLFIRFTFFCRSFTKKTPEKRCNKFYVLAQKTLE